MPATRAPLVDGEGLRSLLFLVALMVFGILSIRSIASYDYFWHLASGRWIVEHGALPTTDPFAVASDRVEWIDGEWLYQIALYLLHSIRGHIGAVLTTALVVAVTFALGARHASRALPVELAFFLALICWWKALPQLGARPSTVAVLFVVISLLILERSRGWPRVLLFASLSLLWINVHPSALLAPVIAALWQAGELMRNRERRVLSDSAFVVMASLLALLINPYGWKSIAAPIELTRWVASGTFTNSEWLPSRPALFPLFFFLAAFSLGLLMWRRETHRLSRLLVLMLFIALAVRSVRNQPIFFASLPLLIAPALSFNWSPLLRRTAMVVASLLILIALPDIRITPLVDSERFPVTVIEQLRDGTLAGNIFNADQFGGFLIWSLYPERRVLTDGRNELYRTFIPEDAMARKDSRAWKRLLDKYDVALALDEYRPATDVTRFGSGEKIRTAASLAFYPRSEWALIGFDDVALLFARRRAFDPSILASREFETLVPDDPERTIPSDPHQRKQMASEIRRAKITLGDVEIVRRMETALRNVSAR
ncbi:MAG TPA: hypothetical protein VNM92_00190 [Thermoanaerobaculia bacterium]|nr:hypothetical protein [Thermoanaerobaculia bacterium]